MIPRTIRLTAMAGRGGAARPVTRAKGSLAAAGRLRAGRRLFPALLTLAMLSAAGPSAATDPSLAAGRLTQIGFQVPDIEAEVADLRARGVTFEAYDLPAFDRATMIATFPANRSAWFKDSEGNLLGIVQML